MLPVVPFRFAKRAFGCESQIYCFYGVVFILLLYFTLPFHFALLPYVTVRLMDSAIPVINS
jgi:hypothetical protein